MLLLTAVNLMLPKLGEHPVTSLDIKHPTLAIILPEVENELNTVLARGWWFNQYPTTLYPDSEGYIGIGTEVLSFVPDEVACAQRGTRLFNPETLDYKWIKAVKGLVTQYVAFGELPESAAQYVWYSALVNAYVTDLGLTNDVQVWKGKADLAQNQLLAEHLRNRKYSTTKSSRFLRLRNAMRA